MRGQSGTLEGLKYQYQSTRYKYHCTKYTSVLRRLAGAPDKEKMGKAKKTVMESMEPMELFGVGQALAGWAA
jgi:hypothetical protein